MNRCRLEFCDSITLDHTDLCPAHNAQLRAGKEFSPVGDSWKREQRLCSEEMCQNIAHAKGLCRAHYLQQYRGIQLSPVYQHEHMKCSEKGCQHVATTAEFCTMHGKKNHRRAVCSVEDCQRNSDARGYCKTHYAQYRRGVEPGPIRDWGIYQKGNISCGIAKCTKAATTNGYCSKHGTKVSNYNMSVEQANYWLAIDSCQSCGGTSSLCIDHDHTCCPGRTSCGECIRGVLCANCNSALGQVHDSVDRLNQLIS